MTGNYLFSSTTYLKLFIFLCLEALVIGCGSSKAINKTAYHEEPGEKDFWIFMMAGQSNMAGRAKVESKDTFTNPHIWMLNKDNEWVLAREPLHFYEPKHAGLDCGMSFAQELLKKMKDSIYIGLVPCAVGGSSVQQWVGDSIHRGVKLLSNFTDRMEIAKKSGSLKAVLWHQGERNANKKGIVNYKANLEALFTKFRTLAGNDTLPVLAGELGPFLSVNRFQYYPDSINNILKEISDENQNVALVSTNKLTHRGDTLHFDSRSQRKLGKRYAQSYLNKIINK